MPVIQYENPLDVGAGAAGAALAGQEEKRRYETDLKLQGARDQFAHQQYNQDVTRQLQLDQDNRAKDLFDQQMQGQYLNIAKTQETDKRKAAEADLHAGHLANEYKNLVSTLVTRAQLGTITKQQMLDGMAAIRKQMEKKYGSIMQQVDVDPPMLNAYLDSLERQHEMQLSASLRPARVGSSNTAVDQTANDGTPLTAKELKLVKPGDAYDMLSDPARKIVDNLQASGVSQYDALREANVHNAGSAYTARDRQLIPLVINSPDFAKRVKPVDQSKGSIDDLHRNMAWKMLPAPEAQYIEDGVKAAGSVEAFTAYLQQNPNAASKLSAAGHAVLGI